MSTKEIAAIGEIVVFQTRKTFEGCKHRQATIDSELKEIKCIDCNEKLDPINWILNQLPHIQTNLRLAREREAKVRVIEEKLQSKSRFACTHCHEVNTIQFDKLASKAAIERKLKVMDDEDLIDDSQ